MACPYFDPGERLPLSSGSLGDLYTGRCRIAGGTPDELTIADGCNLGYARGRCAHFPSEGGPDSVRFSVAKHDGAAIQILYSMERDHRPFENGSLDYSTEARTFQGAPHEALERLAYAYVRSYLRRAR